MNIQTKTLVIIFSSFVALTLILSITLKDIIVENYLQLEQTDLKNHLQRTFNIITLEEDNLKQFTGDWANWDDTYEFITNKNAAYIKSNITDTTFTDSKIAFIAYINISGKLIYGRSYDLKQEQQITLPNGLLSYLQPDKKLLSPINHGKALTGLISIPEGDFIVSSLPILTSNVTGPSRGILIMGRRLNNEFIARLSTIVKLDIKIYRNNNNLTSVLKTVSQKLEKENNYYSIASSNELISGYAALNDINGIPILLIQIDNERAIYQQGNETTNYITLAIIIIMIVIMLVIFILIRIIILKRIFRLSNEVVDIQHSKDINKRITESCNDEISLLSCNINNMLSTIQATNLELEKSRKIAEHANEAKSEFLSHMNHELRTPLTSILGYTELLKDHSHLISSEDKSKYVNQISTSGAYLLRLINGLLDLAAIEEKNYKLVIIEVNIGELIQDCLSMLMPLADNKGISIHNNIMHDEKYIAQADSTALQQVIINIVNNAIKYNKENGQINIECAYILENTLTIHISDNGIGIPSSELKNIFKPFIRIQQDSTKEGTGIGLAVAKNLIELMDGKIRVESELEKGCCFSIDLPLSEN